MIPGRRQSIEEALNRRMGQFQWDGDIAWPNNGYKPVGKPYLVPMLTSCQRFQLGMGPNGVAQWRGVYNVSVRVPRDTGTGLQTTTADALCTWFARGVSVNMLDGGRVIVQFSSAGIASPPAGDWASLPVDVTWFVNS